MGERDHRIFWYEISVAKHKKGLKGVMSGININLDNDSLLLYSLAMCREKALWFSNDFGAIFKEMFRSFRGNLECIAQIVAGSKN